jgi:hypothetical protein
MGRRVEDVDTRFAVVKMTWERNVCKPVLGIRDILVRIRIRNHGSVPLTKGSDFFLH